MFLERRGNVLQIGLGLRDRDARFQPRDRLKTVIAALCGLRRGTVDVRRVLRDRDVEFERIGLDGELKTGRQDTDDGVRAAIHHQGASEHICVTAEMFLPEVMTDDNFEAAGSAAGLFIIAGESAPDLGLDSEDIEIFRARFYAGDTGGAFLTRQGERPVPVDRDVGERAVLVPEIKEVGIRERAQLRLGRFLAGVDHADRDELVRRGKGQRLEQDRVDHAEDGGVRADAERKGEHGDDGEGGMFPELAYAVTDVVYHKFYVGGQRLWSRSRGRTVTVLVLIRCAMLPLD